MLAFSRKQAPRAEVLDVNEVLMELKHALRRLAGTSVSLTVATSEDRAQVRMDRSYLEQVIMALATNAADAMPEGGELAIKVERQADVVVVRIRDTGHGIPKEIVASIFEPFFTTKGEIGTGLGLATAYGYMRAAKASISVDSTVGEGTLFSLRFPAVEEQAALREPGVVLPRSEPSDAPGSPMTVLLVDDDDRVRRGLVRVLAENGHRALEASDADQAIEIFSEESVDLLVTDVAMPGRDGRSLAAALRQRLPGLPVLFMSGHLEMRILGDEEATFLAKPFRPQTLLDKVEQMRPRIARRGTAS